MPSVTLLSVTAPQFDLIMFCTGPENWQLQLDRICLNVHRVGQYYKAFYGRSKFATACQPHPSMYKITIIYRLSIYTYTKHSLLSLKLLALALNSLDILSDIRIKVFALLF